MSGVETSEELAKEDGIKGDNSAGDTKSSSKEIISIEKRDNIAEDQRDKINGDNEMSQLLDETGPDEVEKPDKEPSVPAGGDNLDQEEAALLGPEDPSGDKADTDEHNEEEEERLLGKDDNEREADNKDMSDAVGITDVEASLLDKGDNFLTSKETANVVEDKTQQTNMADTPETTVNTDEIVPEETSNVATTVHELSNEVEPKNKTLEELSKELESEADKSSEEMEQMSGKPNEENAQISEVESKESETFTEISASHGELQSSPENIDEENALDQEEELQRNDVTMAAKDCSVGDAKERTEAGEGEKGAGDDADVVMETEEGVKSKADETEHDIDRDVKKATSDNEKTEEKDEVAASDNEKTKEKDEVVTDKKDEEKEVEKEEDEDLTEAKKKPDIEQINSDNEDVEMVPVAEADDMQKEKKVDPEEMEMDVNTEDISKTVDKEKTKEEITDSSDVEMEESGEATKQGNEQGETIKDEGDKMKESGEAPKIGKDQGETIKDEGDKMNESGEATKIGTEQGKTIKDEGDKIKEPGEATKIEKEQGETIKDEGDEIKEPGEATKIGKEQGETIRDEGDEIKEPGEATKIGKEQGETIKDEGDKIKELEEASKIGKEQGETIKDEQENKRPEQEELKSKEEKVEEDTDPELKIVGVTLAVAVETPEEKKEKEETKNNELKKGASKGEDAVKVKDGKEGEKKDVKEEEEGALGLQISAVSGGVEMVPDEKGDAPKTAGGEKKVESAKEEKSSSKPLTDDDDDDVIAIKEEKAPVKVPPPPKATPTKMQQCIVCQKIGKCKYNIVRNGDIKHLCDDNCFKRFRSNPTTFLRPTADNSNSKGSTQKNNSTTNSIANNRNNSTSQQQVYKTCSVCQLMNIRTTKPFLNWQGMDFCGEECLAKFQGGLNAACSYCASQIPPANKAKFCWRVGNEVKQFCSSPCYSEFVKRLKLCAFCNKDLSSSPDSFMAPVGAQGTFKDFCSQVCLKKFEEKNNKEVELVGMERGHKAAPQGNFTCAVCSKVGPVKHELKLEGKLNRLCSDPCFSAFQYANKLTMNTCDNCGVYCYNEGMQPQYIQFEGQQKKFCSFMCVNTFRTLNKKTVQCAWCSARKSNFDMIERVDANNKYQLFCSLNCLSLYRVNLQATSNQAVTCDQCRKFVPAQYHLTMSDASVRNFCSYSCVMAFQAQFTQPATGNKQTTHPVSTQQQVNTRSANRPVTRGVTQQKQQQQQKPGIASKIPSKPTQQQQSASFPIISNVVSLAPQQGTQQQINLKTTSQVPVIVTTQAQTIKTANSGNQTVQQQIIIQPPPPKAIKNKSLLCKPFVQTKATSCRPHTQTKECQTDEDWEPKKILIPVPVPIYIPCPMMMYSAPTPFPMPIPIPIPVPCFIPTTKKSASSILKYIKEIQEKIPADPLEAELLMMAEAVAGKESESESESESENVPVPDDSIVSVETNNETVPPPASTGTSTVTNDLGEDMLQMALRMASEMSSEPVMDLESSLTPVPVNTGPRGQSVVDEEEEEDEFQRTTRSARRGGRKRASSSRGSSSKNSKKQRVDTKADDLLKTNSPSPPAPAPPLDANMHLKYTYGVNAWKHWVIQKNTQLEAVSKGSGKLKMFKTDLLQCTPDELNYSLCLFVKEVRKPNGEEYAVDSIYYLCLANFPYKCPVCNGYLPSVTWYFLTNFGFSLPEVVTCWPTKEPVLCFTVIGIQQYLFENGRIDNIFTDVYYEKFTECLNEVLQKYEPKLNPQGQLVCRIEEEHLWECKQLGAHSPHVLLNSLVYFNTKYFMLKTSEDHLKLSFTHIMKHWKKANTPTKSVGLNAGRHVYLRYYCPTPQTKGGESGKKKKEEMPVYEQAENLENPLRCPVKLYEFYLSKCPESIKNRNDMFYLVPERSCVPDSPVWYSTQSQTIDVMNKMLNRVRLVREIQESNLHTQPIYI